MIRRLVPVLSVSALLAACSSSSALPDDAVITYAFHDSSVPPQYHRSFTLTVAKPESRIIIDSYGDTLADRTVTTADAVWSQLAATIDSVQGLSAAQPNDGCTGGTGADLTVASAGEEMLALSPQYCGDSNAATKAAIEAWIAPARAMFPPIDQLAPGS